MQKALTFDDVLLIPQYSAIKSRAEIDLSVNLGKNVILKIPIISANMKTVTESKMATVMNKLGGLGILHRFCETGDTLKMLASYSGLKAISIGGKTEEYERLDWLMSDGNVKIICIDLAHGDSKMAIEITKYASKTYPDKLLIAGNVATAGGAKHLFEAGADVIKVGVGSGSLCTTRIETGNGVPQLTALEWIHKYRKMNCPEKKIISDGGIKSAGDIVKALCYADAVMLGNLLAGTDEAPGEIVEINQKKYKNYEGSSTHKTSHIEGIKALVSYKGSAETVVNKLLDGVRSGLSYQNAHNLDVLKLNFQFVEITSSGLIESHPHDVPIIKS